MKLPVLTTERMANYLLWLADRGLTSPIAFRHRQTIPHPPALQPWKAVFVLDGFSQEATAEMELLKKMQAAMGLESADFVACGPEDARLNEYLTLAMPHCVIIAMGVVAAEFVLNRKVDFNAELGKLQQLSGAAPVRMVTFHPRDLLRQPNDKVACWAHLKQAMQHFQSSTL